MKSYVYKFIHVTSFIHMTSFKNKYDFFLFIWSFHTLLVNPIHVWILRYQGSRWTAHVTSPSHGKRYWTCTAIEMLNTMSSDYWILTLIFSNELISGILIMKSDSWIQIWYHEFISLWIYICIQKILHMNSYTWIHMLINSYIHSQQQFIHPAPARGPSRFCPHRKGRRPSPPI